MFWLLAYHAHSGQADGLAGGDYRCTEGRRSERKVPPCDAAEYVLRPGERLLRIFVGTAFDSDPAGDNDTFFIQSNAASASPEPGTIALLASGLAAIAIRRRKEVFRLLGREAVVRTGLDRPSPCSSMSKSRPPCPPSRL